MINRCLFHVYGLTRKVQASPDLGCGVESPGMFDIGSSAGQYGVRRHVGGRHMDALPLTEAVLLILLSLAEEPRHGYAILKDVEEMSDGRVVLSTGTLYGALRRLLEDGWIERYQQDDTSRGRQTYRLTAPGKHNLQLEVSRMKHLTRLAGLRVAQKES